MFIWTLLAFAAASDDVIVPLDQPNESPTSSEVVVVASPAVTPEEVQAAEAAVVASMAASVQAWNIYDDLHKALPARGATGAELITLDHILGERIQGCVEVVRRTTNVKLPITVEVTFYAPQSMEVQQEIYTAVRVDDRLLMTNEGLAVAYGILKSCLKRELNSLNDISLPDDMRGQKWFYGVDLSKPLRRR